MLRDSRLRAGRKGAIITMALSLARGRGAGQNGLGLNGNDLNIEGASPK